MTNVPADLRYTDEHEWVSTGSDGISTVGITDHAQKSLGDIVYFELPGVGRTFEAGEPVGSVESVKSVSELFSPLKGEIVEVNMDAADSPEEVNSDPYGMWLYKIKPASKDSSDGLLDAKAYAELIAE